MALSWLPLIGIFMFFMFTRTARLFDTKGAEEVLAGKESERWKKNARDLKKKETTALMKNEQQLPQAEQHREQQRKCQRECCNKKFWIHLQWRT